MTPWLEDVLRATAADHGDRLGFDVTLVVVHYTGGPTFLGALQSLTADDDRYVSSHFAIGKTGATRQLVRLNRAAFHAGVSSWRYKGETIDNVNRYSIGIELVNRGRVYPDPSVVGGFRYRLGKRWRPYKGEDPIAAELVYVGGSVDPVRSYWEPYTEKQLAALEWLLERLPEAVDQPSLDLVGHEEIAMPFGGTARRQKTDPGPALPWPRFGRPDGTRRTRAELILLPGDRETL